MTFSILDHVEIDSSGRAQCPSCLRDGKTKRNLSVVTEGAKAGAYKCHRGCTTSEIRDALGSPKMQQVPHAVAKASKPAKGVAVSAAKVAQMHKKLMDSDGPAKQWLKQRGIGDDVIAHYQLGISTANVGKKRVPAITIPIPAGGEKYYLKKRVCPWKEEELKALGEYSPWKQWGIPATLYFTNRPDDAQESWLAEGEWDALLLGWMCKVADMQVAVATATCGASTVVSDGELKRLPGNKVLTWFDRNDTPTKAGKVPGRDGAIAYAKALGNRGYIAEVPMPKNSTQPGWDITDAILNGFTEYDFEKAADQAKQLETEQPEQPSQPEAANDLNKNPLIPYLKWNDELLDTAPDHTEFLVPDLLTADELFMLFTGPRMGKSLMAMTLSLAVASGGLFLRRPVTQGTVIYVRLEDNEGKTKEREVAQEWSRGLPVVWLSKFGLSQIDYLRQLVEQFDPRLVVIDTLSRANDSGISESSAEMANLLSPLQDMASTYGCCVLLVHHSRKLTIDNTDNADIFDNARGSTAIRATCRGAMAIAVGENGYRLYAENGWGKHDLHVNLNLQTLRWELRGSWNPQINGDQREQVLDYLKHNSPASIEEMHEALSAPKKSLYKVLERLQASEVAGEKVIKEGKRRCYRYRLAYEATIRQWNTLSNSENPYSATDSPHSIEKKDIFSSNTPPETGKVGCNTIVASPDLPVLEGDSQFENGYSTASNADTVKDERENYQFEGASESLPLSNTGVKEGLNPATEGNSPIRQDIRQGNSVEYTSSKVVEGETGNVIRETGKSAAETGKSAAKLVKVGCQAKYIGSRKATARVCEGKTLTVKDIQGTKAIVSHPDWAFTKEIPASRLERID